MSDVGKAPIEITADPSAFEAGLKSAAQKVRDFAAERERLLGPEPQKPVTRFRRAAAFVMIRGLRKRRERTSAP